jgi:hypothetical protein
MNYLITSAATKNSEYVDYLQKQRDYFESKGALYYGMVLEDRGEWRENTKIKPEAILNAFKINLFSMVLWIDSDCIIDPPEEAPLGDWDIGTLKNIHPKHKCKISAGFILFKNTPNTIKFLEKWEQLNKKHVKDHPALMEALGASQSWLKTVDISNWLEGRHTINALAVHRGAHNG